MRVAGRDSDGNGEFFIDRITGVIRTKVSLDHEEKSMYRLSVAATDNGHPPKQTVRMLRVEVLDLNDNRPTFTSSSLVFQVPIVFSNYFPAGRNYYVRFLSDGRNDDCFSARCTVADSNLPAANPLRTGRGGSFFFL